METRYKLKVKFPPEILDRIYEAKQKLCIIKKGHEDEKDLVVWVCSNPFEKTSIEWNEAECAVYAATRKPASDDSTKEKLCIISGPISNGAHAALAFQNGYLKNLGTPNTAGQAAYSVKNLQSTGVDVVSLKRCLSQDCHLGFAQSTLLTLSTTPPLR